MSRRREPRKLTAEERELWSRVARAARPLHPRQPEGGAGAKAAVAALRSSSARLAPDAALPVPRPPVEPPFVFRSAAPDVAPLGPGAPGLDRRTAERLRRGRIEPEARIDLHGMTAVRAHDALIRFIEESSRKGLRRVLVITGKGAAESERSVMEGGRGVLRRDAPRWLRSAALAPLVVGVYQAHPRHGGSGALYVQLKRRR